MRNLLLAASLISTPALGCETPYTLNDLLRHVTSMDGAVRDGDAADSQQTVAAMVEGLGCMSELLPAQFAGTTFRALGAGYVVAGEIDQGKRWFITAATLEQTFDYGVGDAPDSVLEAYRAVKLGAGPTATPAAVDRALAPGEHYLDGRKLVGLLARPERAHLYQMVSEDGVVHSYVIDGDAFPEAAWAPVAVAEAPKDKKDKLKKKKKKAEALPLVDADGFTKVETKKWPLERVLVTGLGGVLVAAGGLSYGLSMSHNTRFGAVGTREGAVRLQSQTNLLFTTSVVLTASGAGALGFSALFFIVDGQPATAFSVRF